MHTQNKTNRDTDGLRGLIVLYAVAIFLHFPLDIALTLSAWSFETNPVVLALGPERWLFVKFLVFIAASAVVIDAGRYNPHPYVGKAKGWIKVLIVLGFVFVIPNVFIISGVVGW